MKTMKKFRYFSILEHVKEQEYLQEMHRQGWRFVRVSGLGMYHFEECVPEDVVYQLDYNREGLEHKGEYVQMFRDCGWEYIQDYAEYSYFRKPSAEMHGAEEIFCDDSSRLQMMERVFRGRLLPLGILFLCCILPQFIFQAGVFHNYALAGLFGAITGLYVCVFVLYGVHYFRFKSKMKK